MKAIVTAVTTEHKYIYFAYDVYDDQNNKIDTHEIQYEFLETNTPQNIVALITIALQASLQTYKNKASANMQAISDSLIGWTVKI